MSIRKPNVQITVNNDVMLYVYPKVGHWSVEDDRPEFDPAAAKLAWERTLTFLKNNL